MTPISTPLNLTLPPKSQPTLVGHKLAYGQLQKAFHNKIQMPVEILNSFLGLLFLVKPPSAQSEVYGRKTFFVWRWELK